MPSVWEKTRSNFLENVNQKLLSKFRAKLWRFNSSEKKRSSKVIFYQVENSFGNINQTMSIKVEVKVYSCFSSPKMYVQSVIPVETRTI